MLDNIKNIVLFGDTFGISQLLKYIPNDKIAALVCASIRPQYIIELKEVSQKLGLLLLIQPKFNSNEYRDFIVEVSNLKTDLLICNSYSMIIREDIRSLFNNNCINIHTYYILIKLLRHRSRETVVLFSKQFETSALLNINICKKILKCKTLMYLKR